MTYPRPDVSGPYIEIPPVPAETGWAEHARTVVTDWAATVPGWAWALAFAALMVAMVITFPIARAQARKAGARSTGAVTATDKRDRLLLIASLGPAVSFWIAVLLGSARGLIAFGRDDLRWSDGWEYLVPLTLDGIAVSFGLLAFRAVRKNRNPDRAVRVAWGAMIASAGINYGHETGLAYGSFLGGLYLALMSLLGMLIFDELLAQFEDGTGDIRRTNPKFGLRWFTWPTNTVCAWFAWRNHPPTEGMKASVGNAIEHLNRVREGKAQDRAERLDDAPWWAPIVPWVRVKDLNTALAEHRLMIVAEQNRADRINDQANDQIGRLTEAHNKAMAELAERHKQLAEQIRTEVAEQSRNERANHAREIADLRAQMAGKLLRLDRNTAPAPRTTSKNTPERKPAMSRTTDTEALALMFAEHPEPGYSWTDREVNRITGAGFSSRAPRLAGLATEHLGTCGSDRHDTCYSERSDDRSADDKEQAS